MVVVRSGIVKLNDLTNIMDKKDTEEKSFTPQNTTLYNFGYAAKEVIEKFQYFCCGYSTLGESIFALLKRDKLLKVKYRFKSCSVTYQMLAKPTSNDHPGNVRAAMLAMHKYTKEGRYKSVADAIEELLLGPTEEKNFQSNNARTVVFNETEDFQYTELSLVEQEALSKIADALVFRLQSMGEVENKRKQPRKSSTNKRTIGSPNKAKQVKKTSVSPKASPVKVAQPSSADLNYNYSPAKKKICMEHEKSRSSSPKEITLLQNSVIEHNVEPVDIEMVTPLSRLKPDYKNPCKTQTIVKHTVLLCYDKCEKTKFMLNMLNLVPPVALDITSKTTSFVVNLESDD